MLSLQPYITKTYFGLDNPPVNLTRIAMGDGSLGSDTVSEIMPTVCFFIGILRCSILMINVYF